MEHLMGTALGEQGVLLEQHIQQFQGILCIVGPTFQLLHHQLEDPKQAWPVRPLAEIQEVCEGESSF